MNSNEKDQCQGFISFLQRLYNETFPEEECFITRQCMQRILETVNKAIDTDEEVPTLTLIQCILTFMAKLELSYSGYFDDELIAHGMKPRGRTHSAESALHAVAEYDSPNQDSPSQ